MTEGSQRAANGDVDIDAVIQRKIDGCPYRFFFNHITWQYEDGCLTLRGCVPNFYLKQVLQEMLRDVERVEGISNLVDVVSATGLSSEPQQDRRLTV